MEGNNSSFFVECSVLSDDNGEQHSLSYFHVDDFSGITIYDNTTLTRKEMFSNIVAALSCIGLNFSEKISLGKKVEKREKFLHLPRRGMFPTFEIYVGDILDDLLRFGSVSVTVRGDDKRLYNLFLMKRRVFVLPRSTQGTPQANHKCTTGKPRIPQANHCKPCFSPVNQSEPKVYPVNHSLPKANLGFTLAYEVGENLERLDRVKNVHVYKTDNKVHTFSTVEEIGRAVEEICGYCVQFLDNNTQVLSGYYSFEVPLFGGKEARFYIHGINMKPKFLVYFTKTIYTNTTSPQGNIYPSPVLLNDGQVFTDSTFTRDVLVRLVVGGIYTENEEINTLLDIAIQDILKGKVATIQLFGFEYRLLGKEVE